MEAATENGRRGRPPKFTEEEAEALRKRFPHLSERQRQNIYYAGVGRSALQALVMAHIVAGSHAEDFRVWAQTADWLEGHIGVLAELGRMLGKDFTPEDLDGVEVPAGYAMFVRAVRWLGENRPKSKEAVTVLRLWRLGRAHPGSSQELHHELVDKVNDYLRGHPGMTDEHVEKALRLTLSAAKGDG